MSHDPFAQLGLPTREDLSDDDVRVAWRRVAAATHPDRDDGGDPARFGAAAAAYATLRTSYGRGEALAELSGSGGTGGSGGAGRHGGAGWHWTTSWIGVLAVRAGVTAAVAVLAFLVAGWAPSSIGVLAGALTWLFVTAGLGGWVRCRWRWGGRCR